MTSLFFIMLVLFVVVFLAQRRSIAELQLKQKALDEVKKVQEGLTKLDPTYFEFDRSTNRFKLKVDIEFPAWKHDFSLVDKTQQYHTGVAGKRLHEFFSKIHNDSPNLKYLFIIEGQAARWGEDQRIDSAYVLSYHRSLELINFWKKSGYDFNTFGQTCEQLIVGSGYFGQSRYPRVSFNEDDKRNRRFTIQIVPKIGDLESLK